MGNKRIRYEDVEETADEIIRSGGVPTVTAVRSRLGRGSRTTINRHLNTWRESLAKAYLKHLKDVLNSVDDGKINNFDIAFVLALVARGSKFRKTIREAERAQEQLLSAVISLREIGHKLSERVNGGENE